MVDITEKEVFEWGLQKNRNETSELVTSFVTSGVIQEEMEQVQVVKTESALLSDSPSKINVGFVLFFSDF